MPRIVRDVLCMLVVAAATAPALLADECDQQGEAPDLLLGEITSVSRWGNVDGITAYSFGTSTCNEGDCWLAFAANTNRHPVMGQNLHRSLGARARGRAHHRHRSMRATLDVEQDRLSRVRCSRAFPRSGSRRP